MIHKKFSLLEMPGINSLQCNKPSRTRPPTTSQTGKGTSEQKREAKRKGKKGEDGTEGKKSKDRAEGKQGKDGTEGKKGKRAKRV